MNEEEALKLARKFLSEKIQLEVHSVSSTPSGIYRHDPNKEILISFSLFAEERVGSSKFLGVSKIDGTVRYIGHKGE